MVTVEDVSLPPSVPTLPDDVSASASYHRVAAFHDVASEGEDPGPVMDGASVPDLPESVSASDSDVDLPQVDDDLEVNGFDLGIDDCDDEQSLQVLLPDAEDMAVPAPEVSQHLSCKHDIAEYYSVPRVLPEARARGLRGALSLDLLSGWDFCCKWLRELSVLLLMQLNIIVLILSPPCTAFSALQEIFNYKKLTVEVVRAKIERAMVFLRHALDCAFAQYQAGRAFVFEHPSAATSWKTPEAQRILALPGVIVLEFDQCMLGLRSKVHEIPMRKRTKIMTNSLHIANAFRGILCDRSHEHQVIQGAEGGVDRSVWAQCYPKPMVDLLVKAAIDHINATK